MCERCGFERCGFEGVRVVLGRVIGVGWGIAPHRNFQLTSNSGFAGDDITFFYLLIDGS